MIDLSPCDSAPDRWPLSAEPEEERVLHIHLWTSQEQQISLCNALCRLSPAKPPNEKIGYRRINWSAYETNLERNAAIIKAAVDLKPTLVWMQLQTAGVVSPGLLAVLRRISNPLIVSWCGDIGRDPAWSHALAPHVDAMLFSSMTQVEEHRAAGFPNAAYLQIGYDTDVHFRDGPPDERVSQLVFLGQNYRDTSWDEFFPSHEAQLRRDVVDRLRHDLGDRFKLYGPGWNRVATLNRVDSAHAYRFSRCALSISLTSKLKRYSSDRLFRALACGPVVLVKRFAEYSALGLRDGVNCFLFDTPEEASALASRILKETSDGGAYELWRSIGKAGAELAFEHHTWTCRMREQAVYLNYLRRSSHRD